ncbi:MAG TPA: maleylpyruvate isomerase family mycothiol-dependent enzyme [Acidimicrobiales bacterium]|nr:maleylpyruvate isomerase family mycothiol-dependent enzyme [Acidimicrobiales bacterium]
MLASPRYEGPAIISMTGEPDDQLAPLVRQRRRFQATLVDLDSDGWSSTSRCDGWSVQDVVAHLVGVNTFWKASVEAGLAGEATRVLVGFDPAVTPALMVDSMRELGSADVLERFVATNDALLAVFGALDDRGWTAVAETPVGHVPVRVLAHHALWDCWVHERDVALPLGLTPPVEPDEVRSCLRYVSALAAAFGVSTGRTLAGVFTVEANDPSDSFVMDVGHCVAVRDRGDGVPRDAVPLGGDAVALVEALSLRAPLPVSAPAPWRELVRGLATAFDVEVSVGD